MSSVVFRCDAATLPEIGTGHVQRALRLANAMVKAGLVDESDITFLARTQGPFNVAKTLLSNSPYHVLGVRDDKLIPNSEDEATVLSRLGANLLVVDRLDTSEMLIREAQKGNDKVAVFDDTSNGIRHANLVVNAIVETGEKFPGLLQGPKYLIMDPRVPKPRVRSAKISNVFVCFGGYDHRNLAGILLQALGKLSFPCHLDLVIGDGSVTKINELNVLLSELNSNIQGFNGNLHLQPPSFYELLSKADVAILSGGLVAFDAAAAGLPAIGLPQYEHQIRTLRSLERYGSLKMASDGMRLSSDRLAECIYEVFCARSVREKMSLAGPKVVDGKGSDRVVRALGAILDSPNTEGRLAH